MNCSERKVLSTADGLERTNAHETVSTSSSARKKPSKGENTMAAAVMPRPLHTIEPSPALVTQSHFPEAEIHKAGLSRQSLVVIRLRPPANGMASPQPNFILLDS